MVHQVLTYDALACTYGIPVVYMWCRTAVYISYTGGVHMVQQVCTYILVWCTGVCIWCTQWCTIGTMVAYIWCTSGVHMVQQVCNMVHQWCTSRCGRVVQMVHLWKRPSPPRPHPPTGVPCGGGETKLTRCLGSDSVGSNPTAVTFDLSPISWFSALLQGVCA